MRPEGEDQPPEKPERPDQPEYTVYGRGGERRKAKPPKESKKPSEPEQPAEAGGETEEKPAEKADGEGAPEKPVEPSDKAQGEKPREKLEYTVYRSRPSLRDRLRAPDLSGLRRAGGGGGLRDRLRTLGGGAGERRWLRWALIGIAAWFLISYISFAVSSQIQKGELPDSAKDALSSNPFPVFGANTLILGGDRRGASQRNATGIETQGPPRADSIMVIHSGLGVFRKLSIPRDSYAAIPDCGEQKINASLACNTQSRSGNIGLTIETVENFLGIEINHVVLVDFEGFAEFIDTLGGVTIDIPDNKNVGSVCELKNRTLVVRGHIDGGKEEGGVSIGLTAGEHTLEGEKALAFARLRNNICDPSETDIDRAERQQLVMNGIKSRMTSITRLPINFIKGPWIGWNAPKALISDMGGITLPQFAFTSIFGGAGTRVLKPEPAPGPGGSLLIPESECQKKVEELLGGEPPRSPECSP